MTLEDQAKEVALVISEYSKSYSIEPSATLLKPYSCVVAACRLAIVSRNEVEGNQQAYADEQSHYRQASTSKNAHGDPTRVTETAIIPLRNLPEGGPTTDLQNLINRFK